MLAIYTLDEHEFYVSVLHILMIEQRSTVTQVTLSSGTVLETKKSAHELGLEITEIMIRIRAGT